LHFVLSEIVSILKSELSGIKNQNILLEMPTSKNIKTFPLVLLYDKGFEINRVGMGSLVGESRVEDIDEFSGDGKKNQFKLRYRPLRPLLEVKIANDTLRESYDYKVNYSSGEIEFRIPPTKEKNNIKIRYIRTDGTSEIKSLKLKIECNIDIWTKNILECDSLSINIIKAMLISEEKLAGMAIQITPVRGFTIPNEDCMPNQISDNIYGKRLVYIAETDIKVKIKVPAIEDIKISKK
jgi:hypothetical protein